MYFLIPGFKEFDTIPPLWKFITFTQNIGLQIGTAFSHAWSLCIEEQFYLILPILALTLICHKSSRFLKITLLTFIFLGIILRSCLWKYCAQYSQDEFKRLFYMHIYFASYCRLDELIFGVAIAVIKNFYFDCWQKITRKSDIILLFGVISSCCVCYGFAHYHYSFFMTVFGYPMLAMSFAALTIAALSENSYLYSIKIPGTSKLAIWSYAIYLIHKPVSVLVYQELEKLDMKLSSLLTMIIIMFVSIGSGYLLYSLVERPFMKMRDKLQFETKPVIVNNMIN